MEIRNEIKQKDEDKKQFIHRSLAEVQRAKLNKLMENPVDFFNNIFFLVILIHCGLISYRTNQLLFQNSSIKRIKIIMHRRLLET